MNKPVSQVGELISDSPSGGPPWEAAPPGEAEAIAAIAQAIETRVRAAAAANPPAHRDAHPKMHGCVEAEFRVLDDLPPALKAGLFGQPRAYQAWIRFSNGNAQPQPDIIGDGRGMAIKLMGVAGSRSGTQDFIMINNPAFFVRNAVDYVAFNTVKSPLSFFFPSLNPFAFRLHELLVAQAITSRKVSNPLGIQYWSMTPYLFGDGPCKYSARPAGPSPAFNDRSTPNFLHDNLARSLDAAEASFDFCIQLRSQPSRMLIEDPTVEWREADSPFVPVARITIPRQGFDSAERIELGENLSFTPWHGLDAHRPLGGINRVRRTVYETISRVRHELNGAVRAEPAGFSPADSCSPPGATTTEARMPGWFENEIEHLVGEAVDDDTWLDDEASKAAINTICGWTWNRPHPWSTVADYTSWESLTDKTYQGRHLPVAAVVTSPPASEIQKLFRRPGGDQTLSDKSTCLFPAFAQYLTDGFIRTVPTNPAKTTTNHEIDLCPLYGLNRTQTLALRELNDTSGQRGRLKSQIINGEEYAPYLYLRDASAIDPQFAALDPPLLAPGGEPTPVIAPERLTSLFAFGGDRANSTPFTAMMNTLLLREHNRIAGELEQRNPTWDDEHVFQVARNILIPIFIKIVVEQYINHISPSPFNLTADPKVAWDAPWNRPNWITAEFSLLYRWHSLIPDIIDWPGQPIPLANLGLDNRPLTTVGLVRAFQGAAGQAAGQIGAFNTGDALVPIELAAVAQARFNRLDTYNNYRLRFSMPAAQRFSDITHNPAIASLLEELYGTPDKVEFYPGLFAEDRVPKSPLPGLLGRMVAVDAFTQALTNPLLSEHVFNAATFTDWGFDLINQHQSLGLLLQRQGAAIDPKSITMTQPSWTFVTGG